MYSASFGNNMETIPKTIGLELVKQLAYLDPSPQLIIATCRNPDTAQDLKSLAKKYSKVKVVRLDAENEESIQTAFEETSSLVGSSGLNVLINNAGITLRKFSISDITAENLMKTLKVNVVGPAIITKTFLPLLKRAAIQRDGELSWSRAAVINVSSDLGSIGENVRGGYYQYRESKAALNQLTKSLSIELAPQGILATCIHPGWVRTDLGGDDAAVGKEESVLGMFKVFKGLDMEGAGKLFTYRGEIVQW